MRNYKQLQQLQYKQMLDDQQAQAILKPQFNEGAKNAVRSAQYRNVLDETARAVPYQRAAGQGVNNYQ
jgi:hypothetical protein